ncbi:MAG: hypothetical protein KF884_10765 [Fimbriimonadaceae bacterium]|nr:hypothetical protein [Fimbriimonadaceae bacterium]QYK58028.1 MAG: hypothetical protein KF884_10765 [Fimbriimonadaceae bacterium]
MRISRFRSKTDTRPKGEELSWEALANWLTSFSERSEKDGPLWSPAVYAEGARRANENVIAVSAVCLDFDGGHDWDDLVGHWTGLGLAFACHTTWRHAPRSPRWRAVFPLAIEHPREGWGEFCSAATLYLGHGLAEEHRDPARMYYLPSRPLGGSSWSCSVPGAALSVRQVPRQQQVDDSPRDSHRPVGGARPGDEFEAAIDWAEILEPAGWKLHSRRSDWRLWTRPGKAVSDGVSARTGPGSAGDRFYCWSTTAGVPANCLLTKFALYAWIWHGGDYAAAAKDLHKKGYGSPTDVLDNRNGKPLARLPTIETGNRQMRDVTADALNALLLKNDLPSVFVRAGELVRVEIDERGAARIASLGEAALRGTLARAADWRRTGEKGPRPCAPPAEVVQDLASLSKWPGVPPVTIVSRVPVLGREGRLNRTVGYDASSRTYVTDGPFANWDGSLESAVAFVLDDYLADFPFASMSDRAHALALALLPFVRPVIAGPTPLHLVDAPVQGSGKSLLVRACLWPALGSAAAATTATRDEEEWRKKIATALLEGRQVIFLDNLSRKLDSDSLAAALTAPEWNDRALGAMRAINVPVRCVWAATANNAELSRDLARRTVWIRLDARTERPEDRTGFRHEELEVYAASQRPRLVSALCHIIDNWCDAGRPGFIDKKLGSFEQWSKTIGGILCHAGVNGFLDNIEEMRTALSHGGDEEWAQLYEEWSNRFGESRTTAADLFETAKAIDALANLLGDGSERSQKVAFGKALRRRVGIVLDGRRVIVVGTKQRASTYVLENLGLDSPDSPSAPNQDRGHHSAQCLLSRYSPGDSPGSDEPGSDQVDRETLTSTFTMVGTDTDRLVDGEFCESSPIFAHARGAPFGDPIYGDNDASEIHRHSPSIDSGSKPHVNLLTGDSPGTTAEEVW